MNRKEGFHRHAIDYFPIHFPEIHNLGITRRKAYLCIISCIYYNIYSFNASLEKGHGHYIQ
jgi:hypothetical protein